MSSLLRTLLLLSPLLALGFTSSGCGDGTNRNCGEGTREVDGECVADITCGTGTRLEGAACVPNGELDCGEGTFEDNGECVAIDPNDVTAPTTTATPGAGELATFGPVTLTLTADEPAFIYYTTDGSTPTTSSNAGWTTVELSVSLTDTPVSVRYFAADPAGNVETVKVSEYTPNELPPSVTDFTATYDNGDVDLAWTTPASTDILGLIVVRANANGMGVPQAGMTYSAGNTLAGGQEVLFVGTADMLTDMPVDTSFGLYSVYTYDNFTQYGVPATASFVGPAPPIVTDFTASEGTTGVDLAWTIPGGLGITGVIAVRADATGAPGMPVDGTTYSSGDTVTGGQEVLYAGNASAHIDMAQTQSFGTYAVFTHDASMVYGPAVIAHYTAAPPVLEGTISVNLTTLAVTVSGQPANLTLTPNGAATWAGVGDPMTIALDVQNDSDRLLFNLKALIASINDGAASATGDGTYEAMPFFYMGPEALDTGATRTVNLVINGITGASDPLTLDLDFRTNAMMFGSDEYYGDNYYADDSGGTGILNRLDVQQFGGAGHGGSTCSGNSAVMHGLSSLDGRHVYFAIRNQPIIASVDTTTLVATESVDLSGAGSVISHDCSLSQTMGFTRAITASPDQRYLYVTLVLNSHNYECSTSAFRANGEVHVVKLLRETLEIVDRLVLMENVAQTQGRVVSLSADGSRAAIAIRVYSSSYGSPTDQVHGKFFVFDTASMTIIDGDPAAGNQSAPFDLSAVGAQVHQATISLDGTKVYVAMGDSGDSSLRVVDVATAGVTLLTPPTEDANNSDTKQLEFGPDGRLYWLIDARSFKIYDPATMTWFERAGDAEGLAFAGDGKSYYMFDDNDAHWFDAATDTIINNPSDGSAVIPSAISSNHAYVVTPF